MKSLFKCLMLSFLMLLLVVPVQANHLDKVELEKNITQKAQNLLDRMYGPNLFAVVTTVDLGTEAWRVNYTGQANVKVSTPKSKDETRFQILPGYDVIKNLAPDESKSLPFNSQVIKIPGSIQRITLSLTVSNEVSKGSARKSEAILKKLLRLDPKRGDKIEYNFVSFPAARPSVLPGPVSDTAEQSSGNGIFWLFLLLLTAFVGCYVYFQSKILKKMSMSSSGNAPSAPLFERSAGSESKPSSSAVMGTPTMKRYFDFVTADNVDSMAALMRTEKLTALQIGMMLSFLPGVLASHILNNLRPEEQAAVVSQLVDQRIADKAQLEEVESRLKQRLECSVGGSAVLQSLFTQIPNDVKKMILTTLKKDANVYAKLRRFVLLFDDLKLLSTNELKMVLGELNMEILATALVGTEKETKDKVLAALSGSSKDMVKQFMDLKSSGLSKSEVTTAQSQVLDVLLAMESLGKLNLRQKLLHKAAPSEAPVAASEVVAETHAS